MLFKVMDAGGGTHSQLRVTPSCFHTDALMTRGAISLAALYAFHCYNLRFLRTKPLVLRIHSPMGYTLYHTKMVYTLSTGNQNEWM